LFASRTVAMEFTKAAENGSAIQDFEASLLTSQGEWLHTLVSCWKNDAGYAGVIKDITERKRLEEQIMRSQKMESIGAMAGEVAHEFNNILSVILPNAELIKLKMASDPAAVSKFADVIITMSKRANGLTRQLLALGRTESRQVRAINVNDSVAAICRLCQETIGKKVTIQVDLQAEPAMIRADASQLEQILLNLAINARDAMPHGGTLRFHTRLENNRVVLAVRDTGVGITPQVKTRIFDPFFTTKGKSKGSGLGLSVVYNLVKQFNGAIDVQSTAGSGTEFVLSFPTCGDERIRTESSPVGGAERIVIADDEPEMLALIESGLRELGYDVITATNGQEAVEAATENVQLVVTDLAMPVMDGATAIRAVRQKFPGMKILVLSSHGTPESLPVLQRMGIEGFVAKPFEFARLARTIRDVLDGVTA